MKKNIKSVIDKKKISMYVYVFKKIIKIQIK